MVKQLILMIGIPGSGKTTLRNKLFPNAFVISPDENIGYNEEDPWTFKRAKEAWFKANQDLKVAMEDQNVIVFDATFVAPKRRKKYVKLAIEKGFQPIAVFCNTPVDVALKRNGTRNKWRKIPEETIKDMFSKLVPPSKEEGFEEIKISKPNKGKK